MNSGWDLNQVERGLKGAPAAIFLALVLHGGPQTVKHLCGRTAYSDKVVRQGLAHLEEMGLVVYDADFRAWDLEPQTPLLIWLQQGLLAKNAWGDGGSNDGEAELSTELSTGVTPEAKTNGAKEESTTAGEEITTGAYANAEKTVGIQDNGREDFAATAEEFTAKVEDSGLEREKITIDKEEFTGSSGILLTTTTTKHLHPDDQVVVSKQAGNAKKQRLKASAGRREKILIEWLVRGGIGRKTPKMRQLLASDLDLETVKAHVLERMAWEAGLIADSQPYKPGLLIHKLLSGDPPPAMRCEDCLRLPNQQGLCGCDYELHMRR